MWQQRKVLLKIVEILRGDDFGFTIYEFGFSLIGIRKSQIQNCDYAIDFRASRSGSLTKAQVSSKIIVSPF